MILDSQVAVRWAKVNKKYYCELGYIFTNYGDEFLVDIDHIQKGSNQIILHIRCDYCNEVFERTASDQFGKAKVNSLVQKDACLNCISLKGEEVKRLINLTYTFEDWCHINNHLEYLDRWDYKLNLIKPNDVYMTNCTDEYWFKCSCGKHDSELKMLNNLIKHKDLKYYKFMECKKCNSFAQWGTDNLGNDFLEKYWDYIKNNVNPFDIPRRTNKSDVWIKCQDNLKHDSYLTNPHRFGQGKRCPCCGKDSRSVNYEESLEYLYPKSKDLWSDKNIKKPKDYYSGSAIKVWWKCQDGKHKDFQAHINCMRDSEFHCPKCSYERNESYIQEATRLYLTSELGYNVKHEFNCSIIPINRYTNRKLPFDNEVVDLKLIIEVNGSQHYQDGMFDRQNKRKRPKNFISELEYVMWKDEYKKNYALSNGYYYLELPYWVFQNDKYKKLIDNKINEIQSESQQDSLLLCSNE